VTAYASENDNAVQRLAARAARQRVGEKDLDREIFQAARVGLSQREISEVVGIRSQATVQRILRRLSNDPSLLEETPAEVIDRRAAGLIDSDNMMDRLLHWTYSFGDVPSIEGVATDAYISGDWDEIEVAYYQDRLSDQEFDQLMERQRDSSEQAIHTERALPAD
jgi:hypothetical protein